MRHVIFGSDTIIGSSILRVLVSMGNQTIVCCNPDGIIPNDVPSSKFTIYQIDIRSKSSLELIIQKDDILYNCQFYLDENAKYDEFEPYHLTGLRNIIQIANLNKAKKIISYLPQSLSWADIIQGTEDDDVRPTSPYQQLNYNILEMCRTYWNRPDDLLQDKKKIQSDMDIEDKNDTENTNLAEEAVKEEDVQINSVETEKNKEKEKKIGSPNNSKINTEKKLVSGSIEKITTEKEKFYTPLIIARIARFFGPFDNSITEWVCRSVRLQRIQIIGKANKIISWINPVDAGRGMIMLTDPKIIKGDYLINGFQATFRDILKQMDLTNHSNLKIRCKLYLLELIKFNLSKILKRFKIIDRLDYWSIYVFNKQQEFDDSKARKEWGWKPRFDLDKTSKDALNWYVNHIL